MKKQKEALRRQKEEEERQLKLKKEKSRSTVQSIQQGTFSAVNAIQWTLGKSWWKWHIYLEMEEDDDTNNDIDFNDDFWMKNIEGIHRTSTRPASWGIRIIRTFYYGEVLASDL